MRLVGRSLVALVAAFILVNLAGGQQPGGKGKGGFGAGGFGGAIIAQDAASLLRLDQVKKELNVTDDQVEKIPAAILKGLSSVLDDKQMTRLRQIELQQRRTQAYLDPTVQTQLKITPEQSANIRTILDDSKKELAEARGQGKGGNFQGIQEKVTAIDKDTTEKVDLVLTSEQRRAFKQLLGEEFKLEMKGAGGGNFGGGGKKGKKNQDL